MKGEEEEEEEEEKEGDGEFLGRGGLWDSDWSAGVVLQ